MESSEIAKKLLKKAENETDRGWEFIPKLGNIDEILEQEFISKEENGYKFSFCFPKKRYKAAKEAQKAKQLAKNLAILTHDHYNSADVFEKLLQDNGVFCIVDFVFENENELTLLSKSIYVAMPYVDLEEEQQITKNLKSKIDQGIALTKALIKNSLLLFCELLFEQNWGLTLKRAINIIQSGI